MGYAATMVDTENKNAALVGPVITVQPSSQDESERNPIFDALVTSEGEVAGSSPILSTNRTSAPGSMIS